MDRDVPEADGVAVLAEVHHVDLVAHVDPLPQRLRRRSPGHRRSPARGHEDVEAKRAAEDDRRPGRALLGVS
jgi:hypothetical protein